MTKMKVTAESSEETTTTTTESSNPRSKSLYITSGMRTINMYGGTTQPFMKKNKDGGGDSLPVDDVDDDIVNMGVFELNSQVYMIAGKKLKPGKVFAGMLSSDAVYVIDRKEEGDDEDESLHLCRPNNDVPPLPREFYSIPFVVKIRGEIYVLHSGPGPVPEETFFVLRRSNNYGSNSWGWKSLPPPPCRRVKVMGVVGNRLWVDTGEEFCFYDVETEAWGWGSFPDELHFNAVTLSSMDTRSRNYVVICTGWLSYVHAVLVSESGEVLSCQVIDDDGKGEGPLPLTSVVMDMNIEVVELECDGGNCSTFGVLYHGYETLFVKVWTVSLLMETGIGTSSSNTTSASGMISTYRRMDVETMMMTSQGGATLADTKVKALDDFVQVEQQAACNKFLAVELKEQRTYKWDDEFAGASPIYYGRANMFSK